MVVYGGEGGARKEGNTGSNPETETVKARGREVEICWGGRSNGLGWAGARAVAHGVAASCSLLTHLDLRLVIDSEIERVPVSSGEEWVVIGRYRERKREICLTSNMGIDINFISKQSNH